MKKLLLAIIFALMLMGAGETQQTPAIVWNDEALTAAFTDTYTAAGIELALVQVQIFDTAGKKVADFDEKAPFVKDEGKFKFLIYNQLADKADGTYKIKFRVFSDGGSASEWSDDFWAKKEWVTIAKPTGCVLTRR